MMREIGIVLPSGLLRRNDILFKRISSSHIFLKDEELL